MDVAKVLESSLERLEPTGDYNQSLAKVLLAHARRNLAKNDLMIRNFEKKSVMSTFLYHLRLGVASFPPKGEAPQADTGPLLSRVAQSLTAPQQLRAALAAGLVPLGPQGSERRAELDPSRALRVQACHFLTMRVTCSSAQATASSGVN